MKKTSYICIEGTEGMGKGTYVDRIIEHYTKNNVSTFLTKEPGVHYSPLTMALREIALDGRYSNEMTVEARELLMQANRSVHLQSHIFPLIEKGNTDLIIQDRGLLSGITYGVACGNKEENIKFLVNMILNGKTDLYNLYDLIIVLTGDVEAGLNRALKAKKEFESGDAMENKGASFQKEVSRLFQYYSKDFKKVVFINNDRPMDEVFLDIIKTIDEVRGL